MFEIGIELSNPAFIKEFPEVEDFCVNYWSGEFNEHLLDLVYKCIEKEIKEENLLEDFIFHKLCSHYFIRYKCSIEYDYDEFTGVNSYEYIVLSEEISREYIESKYQPEDK